MCEVHAVVCLHKSLTQYEALSSGTLRLQCLYTRVARRVMDGCRKLFALRDPSSQRIPQPADATAFCLDPTLCG